MLEAWENESVLHWWLDNSQPQLSKYLLSTIPSSECQISGQHFHARKSWCTRPTLAAPAEAASRNGMFHVEARMFSSLGVCRFRTVLFVWSAFWNSS
ncbi:hypothetical protein R1flu_010615 [Riccia fluitans]|uniref:Uncharacterized protein n=1 Tax=Riccia fluitans TaxID=41844 RepID=A0ABD1Z5M3_9MARC